MSSIHSAPQETILLDAVSPKDGSPVKIAMSLRESRNGNTVVSFSLDSLPTAEEMVQAISSALREGFERGFMPRVAKDHRTVIDQYGQRHQLDLMVVYWNKRKEAQQ
jgi:hypothetical protein